MKSVRGGVQGQARSRPERHSLAKLSCRGQPPKWRGAGTRTVGFWRTLIPRQPIGIIGVAVSQLFPRRVVWPNPCARFLIQAISHDLLILNPFTFAYFKRF
jgi:hypothetical protein